ncbi:MAG: hypothetical protein IKM04_02515 [Clostridia bacterium]|nr:hypothetical protein [Clostridia bacterium]
MSTLHMLASAYDTGPYRTVVVRGWISDMRCCKKHYLPHSGHVRIEF